LEGLFFVKTCSKCKTEKPLSEFWIDRQRGRHKAHCKSCTVAAARNWRKRNPSYETDRYQKVKIETRERHLVRKYRVSLVDYARMLAAQDGKCAICGALETGQHKQVFHVDHCHQTGRVRGLLCRGCNHMLGHVQDNAAILQRAIEYLVPQIPEIIGRAIMAKQTEAT
jgi:hypothetical protein